MKNTLIILVTFSCINVSCYTSGYTTVFKVRIPNVYSLEVGYIIPIMEKFKNDHIELMIDSTFANNYFKNTDFYFSVTEEQQVFQRNKIHPLYPVINWTNLYSWYMFTPDKTTIYKIGLFSSGFAVSEFFIYDSLNTKLTSDYTFYDNQKKYKILRKRYLEKFNEELLPLLKPYFRDTNIYK